MKLNFGAVKQLGDNEDSLREHLTKILVVDEEPNRNVLRGILRKEYRVETAASAPEATDRGSSCRADAHCHLIPPLIVVVVVLCV